jgi:hypothetical protein
MQCPNCRATIEVSKPHCASCDASFDLGMLETWQHLLFLYGWLEAQEVAVPTAVYTHLRRTAYTQLEQSYNQLLADQPTLYTAKEWAIWLGLARHLTGWFQAQGIALLHTYELRDAIAKRLALLKERSLSTPLLDLEEAVVIELALAYLPAWRAQEYFSPAEAGQLRRVLEAQQAILAEQPEPVAAAIVEPTAVAPPILDVASVAEPTVAPVSKPLFHKPAWAKKGEDNAPPKVNLPKITVPHISWGEAWDKLVAAAVSGALLRGLLYLGAAMIVVASAVLVIRFWEIFPTAVQLLVISAYPVIFYLVGWIVRAKLKLPQAGSVLTAIGALLIALNFLAIYQFGDLARRVDSAWYWLFAAAICTILYGLTAWRLPTEFFGYITLLAASAILVAMAAVLRLPVAWWVAAAALAALLMLAAVSRWPPVAPKWRELWQAGQRLPLLLLPVAQAIVLFVPGDALVGQAATFALATVGYGLIGWQMWFGERVTAVAVYASIASSLGAFALALWAIDWWIFWYSSVIVLWSLGYLLPGWVLRAWSGRGDRFRRPLLAVGFGLIAFGLLLASVIAVVDANSLESVVTYALAAVILVALAPLFEWPWLLHIGSGLFILSLSLGFAQWGSEREIAAWSGWLMVVWAALAALYLPLALRLGIRYGAGLLFWAHGLALVAFAGGFVSSSVAALAVPGLLATTLAWGFWLALVWLDDNGRYPTFFAWTRAQMNVEAFYLWAVAALSPFWLFSLAWNGLNLPFAWIGLLLGGLSLGYVGLGQWLRRRQTAYRLPLHALAYPVMVAGFALSWLNDWANIAAALCAVASLGLLTLFHRRVYEGVAAALLFLWPFQQLLGQTPLSVHAYTLAYALLAAFGYTPLALWIDRRDDDWQSLRSILLAIAYSLSLGAMALSGLLRVVPIDVDYTPWLAVATPLVATGLALFNLYWLEKRPFAWAALLLFGVSYAHLLDWLVRPFVYAPVGWVGLALLLLVGERLLARSREGWPHLLRQPLIAGWVAAALIAFVATLDTAVLTWTTPTIQFLYRPSPILLVLAGLLLLLPLAARLYRNHWLLYLLPPLTLLAGRAFFVVYDEPLFGRMLTGAEYAYVWLGLALLHLLAAALLDRTPRRYGEPLYLGGYGLLLLALLRSLAAPETTLVVLGAFILVCVWSQWWVHRGSQRAFAALLALIWQKPGSVVYRVAEASFLFLAVYAFPFWLAQLLAYLEVDWARRGAALALVAPLYIALGLLLRPKRAAYGWSLFSMGYGLTAVGAVMASSDLRLLTATLTLNAVVYAVSAYLFRQAGWLYLTTVLAPIILYLGLIQAERVTAVWLTVTFLALAFVYLAGGRWMDRRFGPVSRWALPFYLPGYALSAIALALATDDRTLAIGAYSAGVAYYGLSAWLFREAVFLYPAAWLAAVPYYLLVMGAVGREWYGLGWLPLIALYIGIGRYVVNRPVTIRWSRPWEAAGERLAHPALPFYLLAHGLTISMMGQSQGAAWPFFWSLLGATAVYGVSALLFRLPVWLFPALLTGHIALAAYFAIEPSGNPAYLISLPYLVLTWLLAGAGLLLSRRFPAQAAHPAEAESPGDEGPKWKLALFNLRPAFANFSAGNAALAHLLTPSWAQPFFVFVALDLVVWQIVALGGWEVAVIVAAGFALLLALLTTVWQDRALPYATLAYGLLALLSLLAWREVPLAWWLVAFSGAGFALYLIGWALRFIPVLAMWWWPLRGTAVFLTALMAVASWWVVASETVVTAVCLIMAGALYLLLAYSNQLRYLGYFGAGLLQLAWVMLLIRQGINQPQLYAIPLGLYLVVVSIFERRSGRVHFANYLEGFGLAVLLLTTFIQSLNPEGGFIYFLLLLVEGVLCIWWGALRHCKVAFFAGVAASSLNVVAQVILLIRIYDVNRWVVMVGAGVLLMVAAILVERKREEIVSRTHEWRDALGGWQ